MEIVKSWETPFHFKTNETQTKKSESAGTIFSQRMLLTEIFIDYKSIIIILFYVHGFKVVLVFSQTDRNAITVMNRCMHVYVNDTLTLKYL